MGFEINQAKGDLEQKEAADSRLFLVLCGGEFPVPLGKRQCTKNGVKFLILRKDFVSVDRNYFGQNGFLKSKKGRAEKLFFK
jgi:hypothetical protein